MKINEIIEKLSIEDQKIILQTKDADEIKNILDKNNIDIDFDSLKKMYTSNVELSDDELENVNGGLDLNPIIQNVIKAIVNKIKDKD